MTDELPDFYSDPAVAADPKSYFDTLRARCPVSKEPYHGSFLVTGFDAAMAVLNRKDEVFSSVLSTLGPIPPLPFTPQGDDIRDQLDQYRDELPWSAHLVCFDGKKHRDHRAFITDLLTYRRLKQNEEYLTQLADNIIDEFIEAGRCNIVPDFAHATTVYAISDLMGIPEADRPRLISLMGAPPSQLGGEEGHRIGADPLVFLKELFDGYINDRQAQPGGTDLLSQLANSRFDDGSVPTPEMLSLLARLLFGAGQDTTSRLIAMAMLLIADRDDVQERLRKEPARIPDFLEEVLRYDPPVRAVYRLAQKSTVIEGVDVPAGSVVSVCLTAANNDAGHFPDPDTFNIDRPALRDHIAFSKGAHGCPGAPLARMEARIAIERILARTSSIRLSEAHHGMKQDRQFRFEPTYTFRSLSDLHVEFKPA